MLCSMYDIYAHEFAVHCAIALLFMSRNENMQKQQKKYKGVCVLTRFEFSNMDCICVV